MTRALRHAGFSLVEVVVALAVTLVITAAIVDLVAQSRRTFDAEPEAADSRQRVRVAIDALQRDLLMASLVLPYRAVGPSPDPPGTFKSDVVTIVSQQASGPETVRTYYLRRDPASGASQLMRAEGGGGDAPVVDGVTALSFTLYGDAAGSINPGGVCSAAPVGGVLVPITGSELVDGPWCPALQGGDPLDGDLLRVRTIGVRVAVRAVPGEVRFEVTLRNRNQER
jgi:prepilin-type N-terminal cleavage/methylation domain-containing protein